MIYAPPQRLRPGSLRGDCGRLSFRARESSWSGLLSGRQAVSSRACAEVWDLADPDGIAVAALLELEVSSADTSDASASGGTGHGHEASSLASDDKEMDMRMPLLVVATLVQLMLCSPVRADARGLASTTVVQADVGRAHGVLRVQDSPSADKKLDINVTIGDSSASRAWYAQPIWIAVFALAGVVVLVLLVMALRGSGTSGSTVVKV